MKRYLPIKSVLGFIFFTMIVSMQNCGGHESFSSVAQSAATSQGTGGNPVIPAPNVPVTKALALGLLTKNMDCVLCHLNVNGNISGFDTLTFRSNSAGNIYGNIYAPDQKLQYWSGDGVADAGVHDSAYISQADVQRIASVVPSAVTQNLNQNPDGSYVVKPGETHNNFVKVNGDQGDFGAVLFPNGGNLFSMTSQSASNRSIAQANMLTDIDGKPIIDASQFPMLNPVSCMAKVKGFIKTADGQIFNSPINGNSIFVNGALHSSSVSGNFNDYDASCPASKTLTISGEVVINGDLILAGCFSGRGTIYSTGNIYIPDDVKTLNSAFPFPDQTLSDLAANDAKLSADVAAKSGKDMLSLGASGLIVVGPLKETIFKSGQQDTVYLQNIKKFENILSWLAGDAATAGNLYVNSYLKKAFADGGSEPGAVSLVEANLYANVGIAATLVGGSNTNIIINGSVITPNLSILAAGFQHGHATAVNPFNGQAFDHSQINEDYRMKYANSGYECQRIVTQ